jgi:hypothetical protein
VPPDLVPPEPVPQDLMPREHLATGAGDETMSNKEQKTGVAGQAGSPSLMNC